MKHAFSLILAASLVMAAASAQAKGPKHDDRHGGPGRHGHGPKHDHGPDKHGPGHDHDRDWGGWDHDRDDWRGSRAGVIVINQPQYVTLQQQFAPYYREHCPPGQAKKGRCGNFNYVVGQPLPVGAPVWAVPAPVLATLPPPPPQANYVMVDQNLLLIAEGTKRVLDGLVLYSGVR